MSETDNTAEEAPHAADMTPEAERTTEAPKTPDGSADEPTDEPATRAGGSKAAPAGTGAGRSDAPHSGIGAHDSAAINANLAGLAAGTVQLVS